MAYPIPHDTRGIVDPAAMMQVVDFVRYPVGERLDGLVDWFWSVAWDLPDGQSHDQRVLNHPCGHISIGTLDDAGVPLDPPEGRVYGVLSGVSRRYLTHRGWTAAAKTTVGGLGVFLGADARRAANRQLSLGEAIGAIRPDLVAHVASRRDNAERVDALRDALGNVVDARPADLVAEARAVVAVAAIAERDRTVCRVEQLAEVAALSVRSLQRLFDVHVGVAPAFVIRRWRIIEAAEAARYAAESGEPWRGWAQVAAELGYADQAHLTRDFRRHLGTTPAAYVARNRALR